MTASIQYAVKVVGVRDLLAKLGINGIPPKTLINLYGPPMVGKSCLAVKLANELTDKVTVLGIEPAYEEERYVKFLKGYGDFNLRIVKQFNQVREELKQVKEGVVIVDSASSLADRISEYYIAKGYDIRVVTARVVPMLRSLAFMLRQWVNYHNTIGIIITHATSTAGSFIYRGISNLKPSFCMRAGHYIDYELLLEIANANGNRQSSIRQLTVVAARMEPWLEGRKVKFKFKNKTIEVKEQ